MTLELNRDTYEPEVKNPELPIMVDFWGPQCGPCLALMPSVEKLEEEYRGRVRIAKLDVSQNRMLCAKMRVMSVPAFLFYKNGEEVSRLLGEKATEAAIREKMEELSA